MNPEQPWVAKVALAAGYAATGEETLAQDIVAEAVETMPDDAMLLNNAAYTVSDEGLLLEEMIIILERAVELAPRNGMILDSLGWAYYKNGQTARAEELLERAVKYSDDEVIRQHLSEARLANR